MDERFYKFTRGTQWTFDCDFNGDKRTAVFTVASHDDNQTRIEYDIFNPPDPGATASLDEIWYVQDGYVVWGDNDLDGKITPWWRVYKFGSQQGDTWEGPSGKGDATHMGITKVTVPAGFYSDVIHIRLTDEDAKVHDFYYAPTVGLVRWETTSTRGTAVLVLRKFVVGE